MMTQLLVRNLEEGLVRRLKARARRHGVAVEEEHRRILREACLRSRERVGLIDFLCRGAGVAVEVDLEFGRSRKPEVRRTGF
jgi:plasmid stability protein